MERKVTSKKDLVVVVDSLNIPADSLMPFIERIFQSTKSSGLQTKVKVAMHKGIDPINTRQVDKALKALYPGSTSVSIVDRLNFAYAYLKGLERALQEADYIIELDSGGGHIPEEIPRFIKALEKSDVVFSSRFTKGGKNTYPLQRQLASRGVTLLSNVLLGTRLTDAASGFQGFKADVLGDLFKACPPETWVSATLGPFHMYQTDIRARVSWMKNLRISEVPITYGAEKVGRGLPLQEYIPKTLRCFWELYLQKPGIKNNLDTLRS